jgi:hypothetical protein
MLTLISTIFSFLAGGIPKFLEFLQDRGDKRQEIELLRMQIERELELRKIGFDAEAKLEEIRRLQLEMETTHRELQTRIGAQSDEMKSIYRHDVDIGDGASQWVINLRASVRPVVTYGFFILLVLIDFGIFFYGLSVGASFIDVASQLWDENTQALFASVIAFHFGGRAFGKR